jgi:hypothetical protein
LLAFANEAAAPNYKYCSIGSLPTVT